MHKFSFEFGSVDMFTAYGFRIRKRHRLLKPPLRERKLIIPEKSGAYDFGAKYYDEITYLVECDTIKELSEADKREIAYLLSFKNRIAFWDEPDKYYIGRIYDAAEIEKVGGIGTYFPLTFICDPFAYGETVNVDIPSNGVYVPEYAGTAETPTRIEIQNNGNTATATVQITIRTRRENY